MWARKFQLQKIKKIIQLKTPKTHFLRSDLKSKDTAIVLKEIVNFLQKVLQIDLEPEDSIGLAPGLKAGT